MHGIDGNETQAEIVFEILVGGDVAAAALEAHFHIDLAAFADGGDVHIFVEDLDVGIGLDHAGGDDAGLAGAQVQRLGALAVQLEGDLLEVEDDIGSVLNHAGNGLELVQHALDLDGSNGRAFDRREQHAPQRIANGGAEAALKGLGPEAAIFIGERFGIHRKTLGFLKTFPQHIHVSPSGHGARGGILNRPKLR